jgi:hypothetical protein
MKAQKILIAILAVLICFIDVRQSFGGQESTEQQENKDLITKTYDITDIIMPIPNYNLPQIISGAPNDPIAAVTLPQMSGDLMLGIIKRLDKDWDNKNIDFNRGLLLVKQSLPVHRHIEEFLDYLRGIRNQTISIEAKLAIIDNSTLCEIKERLSNTAVLDDKTIQILSEKGSIYKTAKKIAFNGQEIYTSDIKPIVYNKQYDIVIVNAQDSKAEGEAIVDTIRQGMIFGIKPFITPNNNIRMDIKLQNVELLSLEKVQPSRYEEYTGSIELPTTDDTYIKTTVLTQSNKTVIVAIVSLKESNKNMLLLVTPTLIGEEPKKEYFSLTPTKLMKIFDVSSMIFPYGEYFNSPNILSPLTPGGSRIIEQNDIDLPPLRVFSIEEIAESFRGSASTLWDGAIYDSPDSGECAIIGDTPNIVVIHKPDIIKKIEETSRLLSKPYDTSCLVTVNSQLLTISDAYWQNLIKGKRIDLSKNLITDSNVIKEILAETDKSKMVKSIANAEITGFNKQSVCAAQMRQTQYVQDIDVQGGAIGYQPVINSISSGISLNVKPIILKDNFIDLLVDLRFTKLIKLETQTTQQGAFMFQKPQLEHQCFLNKIKVRDGMWAIAQITSERNSEEGLQHNIILLKANVVK